MTTPVYNSGDTVIVTAPIPQFSGLIIQPTSITASIADETGTTIVSDLTVPLPSAGSGTVSFAIDATYNTNLTEITSLRQVFFTFVTAAGNFSSQATYLVRNPIPIARMVNTFVTWPETYTTRYNLYGLTGWDNASDDDRIGALISAHKNMLQLRYRFPIGENAQSRIVDFYGMSVDNIFGRIYVVLADISFYSETDYDGWPALFQDALKRAQMVEANNILSGDPVGQKRLDGIVSETIGESTMQFRRIPDIVTPVCRDALIQLRGFLSNATLIGRG